MIVHQDYILVADLILPNIEEATIFIKRPSSLSFEEVDQPLATDFQEAEDGYYNVLIRKELITETGTYIFKVAGYEFSYTFERECLPSPLTSEPPPGVCNRLRRRRRQRCRTPPPGP